MRGDWVLLLCAACEAAPVVERAVAAPVAVPVVAAPVFVTGQVPTGPGLAQEWLLGFGYRGWTAMTERRMAGEHGGERLFFNDVLAASWEAGAQEHPVGSAAVRELYTADLENIKGFALMVKTGASGDVGEGWFWFEVFGTTMDARPTVAEHGARGCVGCHSHAVDFVHSPATPRVDPQPLL